MRFSTIGIIVAAISVTAYGYASMFQLSGRPGTQSETTAALPMFFDSARVIREKPVLPPPQAAAARQMRSFVDNRELPGASLPQRKTVAVVQPARQHSKAETKKIKLVKAETGAAPRPSFRPIPIPRPSIDAVEVRQPIVALAELARVNSVELPPVPVQAPSFEPKVVTAKAIASSKVARIEPGVTYGPPSPRRPAVTTPSREVSRGANIVTGSLSKRQDVARKFQRTARSSLGGPLPPVRAPRSEADARVREIIPVELSPPTASPLRNRRLSIAYERRAAPSLDKPLIRRRLLKSPSRRIAARDVAPAKKRLPVRAARQRTTRPLPKKRQAVRQPVAVKSAAAQAKRTRAAAIASRKARKRRSQRVRQAALRRRAAQQRRRARARNVRNRNARARRGRRFKSYREFQAYRNRVIANQIRRQRRHRAYYR